MIRNEEELLSVLMLLKREYDTGDRFFSSHRLPEYEIVDALDLDGAEAARFLTFSVIPLHAHPSGEPKANLGRSGLWKVCGNIWRQHSWVYDAEELVTEAGEAELKEFFGKLEIMDDYDAHWWYTSAKTLLEEVEGDPIGLLRDGDFIAPHIARRTRHRALPGIADDVTTPFWLRLMHDQVHELDGMRWLPMAVDHTIFEATKALGELELDVEQRDDRQLVSKFWTVFTQKHSVVPADIERPLRLVGLYWDTDGEDYVWKLVDSVRNR